MDPKVGLKRRTVLKYAAATAAAVISPALDSFAADKTTGSPALASYRILGRTGLKLSVVSFGAMLTPEPEVIRASFDKGVNYIDTARRYMDGRNEEIVATAIKGMRDKLYLATKTLPNSNTAEEIIRDVETSLKKLQTDYIDVIQLHNLTSRDRVFVPEVREALLKLKRQGKVRFFGVTTHTNPVDVIDGVLSDKDKFFDTILVAYNFKSAPELKTAIERAARANIGIIAMKTQAGGYKTEALGNISPHQAALKWALMDKHVTAAIPGMKDMAQLKEDTAVMTMKFSLQDRMIIERYSQAIDSVYCRMCSTCEPTCPQAVSISSINRSLMYLEAYGEYKLAKTTFNEAKGRKAMILCSECPQCVAQCPNGINIATKMKKAEELLA